MAAVPELSIGKDRANGLAHQRVAFAIMLAFFLLAPLVAFQFFLMKVMCFALGVIEGLTKVFYPEASNTVIFIIMAIVLMIKPSGLFGARK